MESTRYEVLPGTTGWVIRRNTHDRAYCGDRESALRIAFALAHGEQSVKSGGACGVWLRDENGTWSRVETCAEASTG